MSAEGLFEVGPDYTMLPDETELFKYFLNDDITFDDSARNVPRSSPQESPNELFDSPESSPFYYPSSLLPSDEASSCASAGNVKKRKPGKGFMPLPSLPVPTGGETSPVGPPPTEEERLLKRQKRLIKNRESAQLSRLRKKMYMEDLERKVCTLTADNEALQKKVQSLSDELIYLRSTMKTGLAPNLNAVKKPLLFNQKSSGAAGICLLLVLFSFGLVFNSREASSGGLSLQHRDPVPDVLPPSQRVLKSINVEPEIIVPSRELVNVFPEANYVPAEADRKKRTHDLDSSLVSSNYKKNEDEWQTKKIKIEADDDATENKGLVPIRITPAHSENEALSTEVKMDAESSLARKPPTSYIYCPQPAEIVVSANVSDTHQPSTVSLLLPSGVLNGTIFNENNENDGLVEISCQVLNIHVWHISSDAFAHLNMRILAMRNAHARPL